MKNILVSGADGFVGKYLVNRLRSENYNVLTYSISDGDISDAKALDRFLNSEIDYVFHLAAKTFVPDSWNNPHQFYSVNVLGTMTVLEFCKKKQIPLTYVSAYLYGEPKEIPIKEDSPFYPNNPYAFSKFAAEELCEFYVRNFGLGVTVIRPFNIYGYGQDAKFLIPFIVDQVKNKNEVFVKDLSPKRDYIYINDLIDVFLVTMNQKRDFQVFNAGSGYSLSVQEVVETIMSVLGKNIPIKSENINRKNEISNTIAEISKLKKYYNWVPSYSFKDGIVDLLKKEL